jgi:anti-sigma factor RsiW
MDPDALDRLLMDRALGALPPDVATLVEAYVERDAAAAARARGFDTAASAARRVLKQDLVAPLPPFPAAQMQRLEQVRRQVRYLRNTAALAAAIVLGFALGAVFLHGSHAALPSAPAVVSIQGIRPSPPTTSAGGFWSSERLLHAAQAAKRTDSTSVIWDSAVSTPRLGGAS